MNEIKVGDVLKITEAELVFGREDIVLGEFKKDTREIKEGDAYVGLKGERFDGSSFFRTAFDNGAKVCIISLDTEVSKEDMEKYFKDKALLKVENTLEALRQIAVYKRKMYDIPVIGVTGSVGKTSTKDLIWSVMSKKYKTLKTIRKLQQPYWSTSYCFKTWRPRGSGYWNGNEPFRWDS